MTQRLPAEWEPQSAVQLTWPRHDSDWAYILDRVLPLYHQLTDTLLQFVSVIIVLPADQIVPVKEAFSDHANRDRLHLFAVDSDDTWARDHGPLTVVSDQGLTLLDFCFNGWGSKYPASKDNAITQALWQQGAYGAAMKHQSVDMVLEGGAIEVDGRGTMLTTSNCLLNPNRNPQMTRTMIEARLQSAFGVHKINWLEHGYLAGDDTDSHIDTLARLCPDNVIIYVRCDDPEDEHYPALTAMAAELEQMTDIDGKPYRLLALPWPSAKFSAEGERMPATYANFLITNGAVLVPVYDDPNDQQALAVVAEAFPDYQIIGLNCLPLIHQHGSLHCITMQIPSEEVHP